MNPSKCWSANRFANSWGQTRGNRGGSSVGRGRGGFKSENSHIGDDFPLHPRNQGRPENSNTHLGGPRENNPGYRRGGRGGFRPQGTGRRPLPSNDHSEFGDSGNDEDKKETKSAFKGQANKFSPPPFKVIPLTASIDLINPWSAYKSKLEIVYEVYAKLDSEVIVGPFGRKEFMLKDSTGTIKAYYYEIDEPFPQAILHQWLKVKAVMRTWGFQTVSVKLSDPTQVLQAKQKVNHSRKYLADKLAQYSNGFSQADVNWSLIATAVARVRSSMTHLVFVYGTLKRGEPNFQVMQSSEGKAEFVSEGRTIEKYPLVIASRYNIPFLLDKPGIGHAIKGEIYRVDDNKLKELDKLENHPDYYTRRQEGIAVSGQDTTLLCWAYFLPKFKTELLQLPMMECYNNAGSHGLPYVERYNRDIQGYDSRKDVRPE